MAMINLNTYRELSEDAQRLLAYMLQIGIGSGKRISEHFYLIQRYCFPTFNGERALLELTNRSIMEEAGKDWMTNTMVYNILPAHILPAFYYVFKNREDLLQTYKKLDQKISEYFENVRMAIRQLADSDGATCSAAAMISTKDVEMLYSVVLESEFKEMILNLSSEVFVLLMESLPSHMIMHDILCDTKTLYKIIAEYNAITEATRCRLISEVELYDYIATGTMPAEGLYEGIPSAYIIGGIRHLESGNYLQSLKWFEQALKIQNKIGTHKYYFDNSLYTYFLMLSYIHVADSEESEEAKALCQKRLLAFSTTIDVQMSETLQAPRIIVEDYRDANKKLHRDLVAKMYNASASGVQPPISRLFAFLIANFLGFSTAGMNAEECVPQLAILRHELSKYLNLSEEDSKHLCRIYGQKPALTSIYHKAEWEFLLEEMTNEIEGGTVANDKPTVRLMYTRPFMESDTIIVREQTKLKNGNWGNGKIVNDVKYRSGMMDCMNNADRRILSRMMHSPHFNLRLCDVIEEMVDDDRLYYGNTAPFEPVKVDVDKPYLIVEKEGDAFIVKSNIPLGKILDDLIIVDESPTHYTIIRLPKEIQSQYQRLLQIGSFPLEAEDSLRAFLPKLGGKVEIHSSLIEGGSTLPIVDGNSKVGFKFIPKQGSHYDVKCFVRPLEGGRHTYKLCSGNNVIIDENENGRVRVKRNFALEESNLDIVRAFWEEQGYDFDEQNTYPPEFMLDLVRFIQQNSDTFFAEWPEGRSMKVRSLRRGLATWNGVLKERGQWFDIEGEISIDENTTLNISELLDLIGKSHGKYIQLNDGEFLALSESLEKQLRALDVVINRDKGKICISPFSAALMTDDVLSGDINFKLDEKLTKMRKRILDSSNYCPEIPKELNATLRPYQADGFQWIARLNSWGAGALLADDMGLGKTIQTIAFLLLKKDEGPSLVVAPASVAPNWKTELEKFAPCLNVEILNFAPDRQRLIKEAKAGDVIVATYGMLLSIQDDICQKYWNIACLDEAHIIKNRGAKTSAAAMKIKADNRVMLTGTPVQNHLGELWSLFQFVNPGLLGTYENFSHKYIVPIEGYQNKERQEQLDSIVHPFMLRRTKKSVLKELPEKTEIYHTVEMSDEELAIYEGIRAKAERILRERDETVDMNVLAEIMRLRQAACSVELIEPKWKGDCSKITALVELLQGVIEGGNRALVFSQFVSFFDIVRRELDSRGMEYFYIDGSIPVKKRTEMVDAFQNGEKAIFLISLKAGGLGLNLTGANYVFHLDPWWNPAIEQQATDRAYRIGQQQAVTVYHLVSHHTIEEKIIRLHQTKRDLADNILAGTDMSYKITGKDLLEMVAK